MNHHVTEPMNHMAIITTTSTGDADGDGDDTEGDINETTVTTTPNADDHTTGDPAIITMPGADQSFYESFLPRPTTKSEISMLLRGASELMIPPLLQYMYVECTMYMALVWGRIPTFPEIYAAFILGIDDSYINVPLDEARCRTHRSRLSCSRRLARLQSQSHSQPRKV